MVMGAADYRHLADAARTDTGVIDQPLFAELLMEATVDDYRAATAPARAELVEFVQDTATYLFAMATNGGDDRTVLAIGRPDRPTVARDATYQRRYPLNKVIAGRPMDRGHFIAYSAGGGYGPNLFAQDRALNRGWSTEGRHFRALERAAVAGAPHSLMFVRAYYVDGSDVPATLDVGVVDGTGLQTARFRNRYDDLGDGDDDTLRHY
jgi:hypothetical protein